MQIPAQLTLNPKFNTELAAFVRPFLLTGTTMNQLHMPITEGITISPV